MQQEDTPPVLAYSPPEPRRRVPLGRLAITAVAFSVAHFITFAVSLSMAVDDDPWGAKGWSTLDRIVDVLSYPLLHLALRFSADSDSVGWGWAFLNSATWGAALSIALAAALTIRRRRPQTRPCTGPGRLLVPVGRARLGAGTAADQP